MSEVIFFERMMTMNNQTRKLTEGALMVALVGMLLFVNRQLAGMLEVVMYWILTFPILVYTARYGIKDAIVPAVSMVLLSFMIAQPTTIFYLISCCIIGIVYGYGVLVHWSNSRLLWVSGILTFVTYFITTVLFAAIFGYDPADDILMVQQLLAYMNVDFGIPIGKIVTFMVVSMAVLMSVLQTICIHMIANIALKRMQIEVWPMKTIFQLKVSNKVGYAIILIWLLFLARNVLKLNQDVYGAITALYLIAKVFATSYGVVTLLCVSILIRRRMMIIVVFVLAFVPYIQGIIAAIGVIDMIVDVKDILVEIMKRGVPNGAIRKH